MTEFSNNEPLAAPSIPAITANSWEGILANLRQRYPGQKDSVLFCLHKLHSNPDLGLPDFREEAALHGIPMAGRALHSAKVLLGLATVKPRVAKAKPAPTTDYQQPRDDRRSLGQTSGPRGNTGRSEDSIETKVLDAVRQIQSAAGAEADRLRHAVRQAIAILQAALKD